MYSRVRQIGRRIVLSVLFVVTLLSWTSAGWAATRIGNAELQMWYRTRQTFHTNGGRDIEWVQWRNEVFFWIVYQDFVKNGKIFDKIEIPAVKSATFNARYRFRADPVWSLRESYRNHYDKQLRKSFLFPENGFRDIFLDLDFGKVGPGGLSMRIGNQQIVWGESDLYRSIDVINPLRIDQNQPVGEKFDEFRSPIWAVKWLYNIGDVGSWFSNVSIEPFWSPRYRDPLSDLILNQVFRIPFQEKGCLDDNNNLIKYSASACAKPRADGSRVFVVKSLGSCKQVRQQTWHFSGIVIRWLGWTYSLRVRLVCASAASSESVVVQTH
jgi:hypothetical protein